MAITKTQIFIASRFEEFSALRGLLRERINSFQGLPLQAIDLNDNAAGPRPALSRCLGELKSAEVMILLVGETYGGSPPGAELSFTHLEYRAAIDENSQTVVLPFFIGASYADKLATLSPDPKLAAWQREILDNHTSAFYSGTDTPGELCQVIFEGALANIYEARISGAQQQTEQPGSPEQGDLEEDSAEEEAGSDSIHLTYEELESLERFQPGHEDQAFDSGNIDLDKLSEILARPAEIAALEQQGEAFKAIDLGNRFVAIKHFKRALEHRPLDLRSTYWLARLLVTSGRKDYCREAMRHALMSCQMADFDNRVIMVSASFMVAAAAAAKLEEFDLALGYAKKATEITPKLAAAKLELACQYANRGDLDQAFKIAQQAFYNRPQSILKLDHAPAFQKHRRAYEGFKERLRDELVRGIQKRLLAERSIVGKMAEPSERQQLLGALDAYAAELASKTLLGLVRDGRRHERKFLEFMQENAGAVLCRGSREARTMPLQSERDNSDKTAKNALGVAVALGVVVLVLLVSKIILPALICFALLLAALYTWQTHRAKYQVLDSDLSAAEGTFESEIDILARCIVEYENSLPISLFAVGGALKAAQVGDIVRIDHKLHAEQLAQHQVDGSLLPASLAGSSRVADNPGEARIRNYRVVAIRGGIKRLSRSAVYFA